MASPVQGTTAAPVKKAPRSSLLRSCERCRRRKIRCDDYFPCAACTRLGLQCKLSDDRKAERSQSFLEERVKRLESLLAQHENRTPSLQPATASCTETPYEYPRLQIPACSSPISSTTEDALTSPGGDQQDYLMGYVSSYCSSPVDFASSPAGDVPPWSSFDAWNNLPDQPSSFDCPTQARSFPSTPGNKYTDPSSTDFSGIRFSSVRQRQPASLIIPDIPTIEVTSWETQPSVSQDEGMHETVFHLPDLSVGSWSGPPSPSLTAGDHGFLNDDYLTDFHLGCHSRKSSIAFSDGSFGGLGCLSPDVSLAPIFSHSRPRSRSDVLPQSNRYLHAASGPVRPDHSHCSNKSETIPGADEASYTRTFFQHVHPYFPVLSPHTFQLFGSTSTNYTTSEQQPNIKEIDKLLILAIGSQFQNNIRGRHSTIPGLYFHMAQDLFPKDVWQQSPTLKTLQEHLLLAIYVLLSTYCPFSLSEGVERASNLTNPSIWMLNAFTTGAAIDLNLHVRKDLDDSEKDIFISVYTLDNVVSMLLGRPSLLRGMNIDVSRMRKAQTTTEVNQMRMDELASEDVGSGWKCVLKWFDIVGHDSLV